MNKSIDKNSSQWTSSDGDIFNYTCWSSNQVGAVQPNLVLIAVHGLGGSANDFDPLGNHLAHENIISYAYEMRTQGNDPKVKRRGDLIDWHILTSDLKDFCDYVYTLHPETTHILAGESMGAVVAINACAIENYLPSIDGLILFTPVTELDIHFQRWQIRIWQLSTKIIPWIKFPPKWFSKNKDRSTRVSSDDEYEKYLVEAPHRIKCFTLRFYYNLYNMIENCSLAASKVKLPVLLLYAGKDIFIKADRSESFFARLNSTDKQKHFYPEAFHLLLHDTNTPDVLSAVVNWIDRLQNSTKNNE
jgi:alpha-beta hydrolase superfamily lysophospholipase